MDRVEEMIEDNDMERMKEVKLTKEEIEIIFISLDGVAFTTNVNNFAEVSKKIKLIEQLKIKLKKESEE